jgi:amino acid transporter
MFKRRETIIFLILTVGIITLNLLELNQLDFIIGLGRFFLYFVFFCTLIYALYRLKKDRRQIPFFQKAKPLMFGIILTGFFFLLSYLVDTDGGKKRVITGGANHDPSFIHFQLFGDNTFKFLNSGPFGGNYYRGTYSLQNDTLRLNNDSLKYLYPTLTLVLKEADGNEKYFESLDTLKFKDKLFISTDNRSCR